MGFNYETAENRDDIEYIVNKFFPIIKLSAIPWWHYKNLENKEIHFSRSQRCLYWNFNHKDQNFSPIGSPSFLRWVILEPLTIWRNFWRKAKLKELKIFLRILTFSMGENFYSRNFLDWRLSPKSKILKFPNYLPILRKRGFSRTF